MRRSLRRCIRLSALAPSRSSLRSWRGLTANLIKKSTRHFNLSYHPGLPTLSGNAQRIEQVVINLVVNACQALPDNDRPVTVSWICMRPRWPR